MGRLAGLIVAALVLASPLVEAAPRVQITATLGLGGYTRLHRSNVLHVTIENRGDHIDGQVVVSVQAAGNSAATSERPTRFSGRSVGFAGLDYELVRPAAIAPGGTFTSTFYVPLRSSTAAVRITLRGKDGREITRTEVRPRRDLLVDRLIAVLSRDRAGLEFLSVTLPGFRTRVLYLDEAALPTVSLGYEAIDILVVRDLSERALERSQREALESWVFGGGNLVVSVGPNYDRFAGTFLDRLLPVRLAGTQQASWFKPLADHLQVEEVPEGTAVIAQGEPEASATAVPSSGLPLIVRSRRGVGRVTFWAFDFLQPPLRDWPGRTSLWHEALAEAPSSRAEDEVPHNVASSMLQDHPIRYPQHTHVALFVLGTLGAVEVMRRLAMTGRLPAAAIPVVIVMLSAGAVEWAATVRSRNTIVSQFSVVTAGAGRSQVETLVAMYTQDGSTLKLATSHQEVLVKPIVLSAEGGRLRVIEQPTGVNLEASLPPRATAVLLLRHASPIRFNARVIRGSQGYRIHVNNSAEGAIREPFILWEGQRYYLADIESGEDREHPLRLHTGGSAVQFNWRLFRTTIINDPIFQERQALQRQAFALLRGGWWAWRSQPLLMGWVEEAPLGLHPTEGRPRVIHHALLRAFLPVTDR
ncbi:MAG: hypothetical protein HY660_10555 [Armatimonadetes bacterium]|nr:hypothetical protein [Armatimonadota bacterium]